MKSHPLKCAENKKDFSEASLIFYWKIFRFYLEFSNFIAWILIIDNFLLLGTLQVSKFILPYWKKKLTNFEVFLRENLFLKEFLLKIFGNPFQENFRRNFKISKSENEKNFWNVSVPKHAKSTLMSQICFRRKPKDNSLQTLFP